MASRINKQHPIPGPSNRIGNNNGTGRVQSYHLPDVFLNELPLYYGVEDYWGRTLCEKYGRHAVHAGLEISKGPLSKQP